MEISNPRLSFSVDAVAVVVAGATVVVVVVVVTEP